MGDNHGGAAAIVGVAGIVVAVAIFIWQERRETREVSPILGSHVLQPDRRTRVFLGVPMEPGNSTYLGKLPLLYGNTSPMGKTVEKVEVVCRFPKSARESLHKFLTLATEGVLAGQHTLAASQQELGNFSYFVYAIDSLNPGHCFGAEEPFVLHETRFTGTYDVGRGRSIDLEVSYALDVNISVSGRDLMTTNFPVEICVINVKAEDLLLRKAVSALGSEMRQEDAGKSFWQWLLTGRELDVVLAFAEPTLVAEVEGGRLYEVSFPREHVRLLPWSQGPPIVTISLLVGMSLLLGGCAAFAFSRWRARKHREAEARPVRPVSAAQGLPPKKNLKQRG